MDYSGTWDVVSGAGSDAAQPNAPGGAHHVSLEVGGGLVTGDYHLAAQQGSLHGRLEDDGSIVFTSEGAGEQGGVRGAGSMRLEGERLQIVWRLLEGQEYTFEATRRA